MSVENCGCLNCVVERLRTEIERLTRESDNWKQRFKDQFLVANDMQRERDAALAACAVLRSVLASYSVVVVGQIDPRYMCLACGESASSGPDAIQHRGSCALATPAVPVIKE